MSLLFFCPLLANRTSLVGENASRRVRVGARRRFQAFGGASVFLLLRPFATTALILKTRSSSPEAAVQACQCSRCCSDAHLGRVACVLQGGGIVVRRAILAFLLCAAPAALGQSNYAVVTGTLTDPQQSPVAGSSVLLTAKE